MAEKLNGLIVKDPKQGAPSFVVGALSFKTEEFIESLRKNDKNGWVNLNLKRSKEGKLYAEVDTWEPSSARSAAPAPSNSGDSSDLPF